MNSYATERVVLLQYNSFCTFFFMVEHGKINEQNFTAVIWLFICNSFMFFKTCV